MSTAAAIAAPLSPTRYSHRFAMFWFSGPVGRSSTTVPIAVPLSLPSSQTVCTAMTRLLVSSVVGSFCSVDCATS